MCRTTAGRLTTCDCAACNTVACANTDVILTSCTGRRFVRARISASGSASGSVHRETHTYDFPGSSYVCIFDGTWSFSFNATGYQEATNPFSVGLTSLTYNKDFLTGEETGTLLAFGSVGGTASGTTTITDPENTGPGGTIASGSLELVSMSATISAETHVSVPSGGILGTGTIDVSFALRIANGDYNPDDPDNETENPQYFLFFVYGSATFPLFGNPIVVSTICSGASIEASGGPTDPVSGGGPDRELDVDDPTNDTSSFSGSFSTTSNIFNANDDGEEGDLLLATSCARFLTAAAHFPYGDDYGDLTGRVVQFSPNNVLGAASGRCQSYSQLWQGAGALSYDASGSPKEIAVAIRVAGPDSAVGNNYGNGVVVVKRRYGSIARGTVEDTGAAHFFTPYTSGTFTVTVAPTIGGIGGGTTAPIAIGAAAGTVQAAIELLPGFADGAGVVRVEATTEYYIISVAFTGLSANLEDCLPAGIGGTYYPSSGPVVSIGGYEATSTTVAVIPIALNRCPELGVTPLKGISTAPAFNIIDDSTTLSFSPTPRIASDPPYYCDCGSACTHTSVVIKLRGGVTKDLAGTQTSADPCSFLIDADADYHGTYAFDSKYGRMKLTLSDDDGVVLIAFRYCSPGGQLGPLTIDQANSPLYADLGENLTAEAA